MTDALQPIRVLVADDHGFVRETIKLGLERNGDFAVEAATDFEAALRLATQEPFDIVLLDLAMPGMDGIASIQRIVKANEAHKVVLFSGSITQGLLLRATDAGVRGFISKTMGLKSIAAALRLVHDGEVFIPISYIQEKSLLSNGVRAADTQIVSPLESTILERVSHGKTNKEIAWDMQLSEVAIKMHMRSICKKLDAKNRAHAAIRAREMGLLQAE